MVSCFAVMLIILFCIALFIFSKTNNSNAKTKSSIQQHKKIAAISQKAVFILLPHMTIFCALALITTAQQIWSKRTKNPAATYTATNICVWEDELYGAKVDPAALNLITRTPEEPTASGSLPEEPATPSPLETDVAKNSMEIQPIEETHLYSYDYSLLEFFGHYEFGETITKADLANMRTLYGEYWNQKPFWDMLYITDMDSFTISEALKRVTQFDSDMMYNSDTLTAADYYKNSQDRLFLYWHGEEYKTYLESSAVSAESAVELQTVTATDGYQTLFQYIRTTAAEFSCVLDDGTKPYISGSEADLKYRIGKALYKPAINLQKLTRQEKYYSLCSSYTTLKDAFYQGTPDSRYSIETSYHYLLVCNDIFQAMKPEEREEVYQEAMAAYCRFRENGEFPSPKQIYLEYQEDAKGIVEDLNSQIIEDKKHELP